MPRKPRRRGYRQGTILRGAGGTFRIRWREGSRRFIKSGLPDRDTAERVLERILKDVAEGDGAAVDPREVPPLAELAKDWLARRKATHRAHSDDASRWRKHLEPAFGHRRPGEVKQADIRAFVEQKLGEKLSSTTAGHCVRLLSSMFTDLVERGLARSNPVRDVPRATRRLFKNAHDPRTTPFLERAADIGRVYLALAEPFNVIYAVSALGGLRPGEALALEWTDIDIDNRRIHVQRQVRHGRVGVPKSGHGRVVPISPELAGILRSWKRASGGGGRLFPPENPKKGGRRGSPPKYIGLPTVHDKLSGALKACKLPALSLYESGRHTFASHFVLGGGSIEHLAKILGHASSRTSERYSHLRPEMLSVPNLLSDGDLSRGRGAVLNIARRSGKKRNKSGAVGHRLGTTKRREGAANAG